MTTLVPSLRAASGIPRRVDPEWLDTMPACDPRAVHARHDLRRLNHLMGSVDILLGGLDQLVAAGRPLRLVELGAGDGWLMLQVAQRRRQQWGSVQLTLLDRHPLVDAATVASFRDCGWCVEVLEADVFRWLASARLDVDSVVVANLFLHHFVDVEISKLLAGIAGRARGLVCCEPRRSAWSLAASRAVGLIGCNAVTRHDAVISVRAGFTDAELSQQWPSAAIQPWELSESAAGMFSHCFVACRVGDEQAV